jgi:hypothetical protein
MSVSQTIRVRDRSVRVLARALPATEVQHARLGDREEGNNGWVKTEVRGTRTGMETLSSWSFRGLHFSPIYFSPSGITRPHIILPTIILLF